jgi:predicted TPR repeat methyltransferase
MSTTDNANRQAGRNWLLNNDTDAASVERYYDDWAGQYDAELTRWNYQSPDEAARLLAGYASPGARVLDAGCGTGLSGQALAAAGFSEILGIDISTDSLRIAAQRSVYREVIQVNLQVAPLPFGDDTCDAVSCVGVMTYIIECEALLREFCRVVRPGGHVLFTCRDDLYAEHGYETLTGKLVEDGCWRASYKSPPSPYLPGNEDFAEMIKVLYLVYEVRR